MLLAPERLCMGRGVAPDHTKAAGVEVLSLCLWQRL